MNYSRLIIHLVIVLLFTFSCKTFHKEVKEDIVSKEDSDNFFEVDNKKLDSNYIKAGCVITDSIKNQIPDETVAKPNKKITEKIIKNNLLITKIIHTITPVSTLDFIGSNQV